MLALTSAKHVGRLLLTVCGCSKTGAALQIPCRCSPNSPDRSLTLQPCEAFQKVRPAGLVKMHSASLKHGVPTMRILPAYVLICAVEVTLRLYSCICSQYWPSRAMTSLSIAGFRSSKKWNKDVRTLFCPKPSVQLLRTV